MEPESEDIESVDPGLAISVIKSLRKFQVEEKYYDVKLQVGSENFKCQRFLLAATSGYFDTMFSSNFKEKNTNSDESITLHGIDATTFNEILDFMYTGRVHVTRYNVSSLLYAHDFLELRVGDIDEQCIKYLEKSYHKPEPIPKVLEMFTLACATQKERLVDILSAHICLHLPHFLRDTNLMETPFTSFNAFLKCSKKHLFLFYGSENYLLKVIIYWINHSRKERGQYRSKLMEHIDSSNVSSEYFFLLMKELEKSVDVVFGGYNCARLSTNQKRLKLDNFIELNDNSQCEATLTLKKTEYSKMKLNEVVISAPRMIQNLFWKIFIRQKRKDELGFYLECDGPPDKVSSWSCKAYTKFIIVSQQEGVENFIRNWSEVYSSKAPNWGYELCLNSGIKLNMGCIKDDTVIFKIEIKAEQPCFE